MTFIYSKHSIPIPTTLPDHLKVTEKSDPFDLFGRWLNDALDTVPEANAMAVATSAHDIPSSRIVYLRFWDRRGLVFFTNLHSHKGNDIAQTGRAELHFFWKEVWRQVRVGGVVEEVEKGFADAYFAKRDRESQLGAWASKQSQPTAGIDEFTERLEYYRKEFEGRVVPRPEHWSGLRLLPTSFEFWQGRPARWHERWRFTRDLPAPTPPTSMLSSPVNAENDSVSLAVESGAASDPPAPHSPDSPLWEVSLLFP